MTLEEAKKIVLFQAFEDIHGLWEILREGPIFDIPSGEERLALARDAVMELLAEGHIQLYLYEPIERAPIREIAESEWDRVLSDPVSWDVPNPQADFVGFESTPKGDALYRADPW